MKIFSLKRLLTYRIDTENSNKIRKDLRMSFEEDRTKHYLQFLVSITERRTRYRKQVYLDDPDQKLPTGNPFQLFLIRFDDQQL